MTISRHRLFLLLNGIELAAVVGLVAHAGAVAADPGAKQIAAKRAVAAKITHWKHGGIVGVLGYGSGIIGRYTDLPDEFPGVEHFHTVRVNQPSGWFYTTKALRELWDIWDEHGSSILNVHGSTGDMIFLGTTTPELEPCFE